MIRKLKDAINDVVKEYEKLLDVSGIGIMGYIEIPAISCTLPVYHGTSDAVLQIAVGHLDWTSLPVGGESTHSVMSAHRGLPTAVLFTNLDRMEIGDIFTFTILDRTFTYEGKGERGELGFDGLCNVADIYLNGQKISSFSVYAFLPHYKKKKIQVFEGKTVGHKVFCKFSPIRATKYEVVINASDGEHRITDIKAFYVK